MSTAPVAVIESALSTEAAETSPVAILKYFYYFTFPMCFTEVLENRIQKLC